MRREALVNIVTTREIRDRPRGARWFMTTWRNIIDRTPERDLWRWIPSPFVKVHEDCMYRSQVNIVVPGSQSLKVTNIFGKSSVCPRWPSFAGMVKVVTLLSQHHLDIATSAVMTADDVGYQVTMGLELLC